MPQRKVGYAFVVAGHRFGVGLHALSDESGERTGDHPGEREYRRGRLERGARTVHARHCWAGFGLAFAAEGAPQESQRVGDGQSGSEYQHQDHHRPLPLAQGARVPDLGEGGLLADESQGEGEARHAGGRECGDARQHRGAVTKSGKFAQVAGTGGVVDDADHHEQRRFEQRMGHQHRHRRHRDILVADADQHHQEPQLRDRSEGEHQLEVVFAQRPESAEDHGGAAEPDHQDVPGNEVGEARGEPGHQEDSGLDHGCGMQIGTDRGGGRHGTGKPEVEREDRRLAERTDQDQDDGHGDRPPDRGVGHDVRQQVGAGFLAQHHDADQHRESTGRGHEQGLGGGPAARRADGVETDQQERQHRGQFPEDVEHEHVVADDQPEHRAGEGHHLGREAGDPTSHLTEVLGAVTEHQGSDPEHQNRHDGRERVEAEVDVHLQGRDPAEGFRPDAVLVVGPVEHHPHQAAQRGEREEVEAAPAQGGDDRRGQHSRDGQGGQDCDQEALRRSNGRGVGWVVTTGTGTPNNACDRSPKTD